MSGPSMPANGKESRTLGGEAPKEFYAGEGALDNQLRDTKGGSMGGLSRRLVKLRKEQKNLFTSLGERQSPETFMVLTGRFKPTLQGSGG